MKVLIIEDEPTISSNISKYLKTKWVVSDIESDGKKGFQKALLDYHDIIILDVNLPSMNWWGICENLRLKENTTPILMLTSNDRKEDIVKGLHLWADDYLTKFFDYDELFARLESLNRRNLKNKSNIISIKWDITIDIEKKQVTQNWKQIKLSSLEFHLLEYLAQNKWVPLNRKDILEKVWWDFDTYAFSRNVDIYIWYLRKKLWNDIIETKKWEGYVINCELWIMNNEWKEL